MLQNYFKTWYSFLIDPLKTLKNVKKSGNGHLKSSFKHLFISGLVASVIYSPSLFLAYSTELSSILELVTGSLGSSTESLFLILLSVFIVTPLAIAVSSFGTLIVIGILAKLISGKGSLSENIFGGSFYMAAFNVIDAFIILVFLTFTLLMPSVNFELFTKVVSYATMILLGLGVLTPVLSNINSFSRTRATLAWLVPLVLPALVNF